MFIFKVMSIFFSKQKFILLLYIICTISAFPLESIVIPQIYSNFFNVINNNNIDKNIFLKYFLLILFFLIIINLSVYITNSIEGKIVPELDEFIMNYIFKNILIKYQNNYTDIELGKIITRLNAIPVYLKALISDAIVIIFPRLLTIILLNIYFTFLNWKLGLISFILFLLFLILNSISFSKCSKISNEKHILLENKNEEVQDKLSNLYSIYSNDKMDKEIEDYKSTNNEYVLKFKENLNCLNNQVSISNLFNIMTFIIINSVTTYLYLNNEISFNNLMAVFITIIYYSPCMSALSFYLPDFINFWGSLKAIDDFIEDLYNVSNKNIIEKYKDNVKIDKGIVNINNLNFKYNNNKYIFQNFNLKIKQNEKIAIIGASGNGKSTLIKLIMGYYKVDDNSIFIDNVDINNYNLSDLRNQISFVNQNNRLFNKTILENIQYGNDLSEKEIINLMQKLDIENIFKNLEMGLKSNAGINGENLSGGQKQMVYFLRCFGKKNKILILDEPTAAIDKKNTENIVKAIKEISKNCTVILITHDESILHFVDRIITIDSGKIVNDIYQNNNN